MRKTRKIKDFDSAGKFGKDDNRKILSERLKDLQAHYEEKRITANELFKRVKANGGNISNVDTVNKWIQGRIFPSEENLIALAKAFPPYSADYFRGITEAPDYNYQYIMKETGLSWQAIDHLKNISKKHKDTLNTLLESEYLDTLVEGIEEAEKQKYTVLSYEKVALSYLCDYIDYYISGIEEPESESFNRKKTHLQNLNLEERIERLSDEEIRKPFRDNKHIGDYSLAFQRIAYKMHIQDAFTLFFEKNVPELKALHYPEIKAIYERIIKPTDSDEAFSYDYYLNVLKPLQEILEANQKKDSIYDSDYANGTITENEEISHLIQLAKDLPETSGSETTEKPTQKKSKRKKV